MLYYRTQCLSIITRDSFTYIGKFSIPSLSRALSLRTGTGREFVGRGRKIIHQMRVIQKKSRGGEAGKVDDGYCAGGGASICTLPHEMATTPVFVGKRGCGVPDKE